MLAFQVQGGGNVVVEGGVALLTAIIMGLLLSPAANRAGACDDFPFRKLLDGAPRYSYRGEYVNRAYEYAVMLPEGLTAYDGRDQANHEGFGLALGEPPQSFIFVRGEHNSLEYETPRDAATQMAEWMREEGKQVESATVSDTRLGELDAALLEVSYACPGSSDRHRRSSLMALGPDRRFLYTVELYSPAARYESDRAVLDEIINSWKTLPAPRRRRQP